MTVAGNSRGFTLTEMLVSLTILTMAMGGLAGLLVENGKINRKEQMAAEAQANARSTLSMVVQKLRTAGWDPALGGIPVVALDPDPVDSDNYITAYADLNEDGDAADADEEVTIRWTAGQVDWRKIAAGSYTILATDISNDEDGDGTAEAMFTPDSTTNPTRVTVKVTARSRLPDPVTGQYFRFTVTSDVVLRKNL